MRAVAFPPGEPSPDAAFDQAHAFKVLEEADELAEVFDCHNQNLHTPLEFSLVVEVLDKAMDVYQSLVNLLAAKFTSEQIEGAYQCCVRRNRERW